MKDLHSLINNENFQSTLAHFEIAQYDGTLHISNGGYSQIQEVLLERSIFNGRLILAAVEYKGQVKMIDVLTGIVIFEEIQHKFIGLDSFANYIEQNYTFEAVLAMLESTMKISPSFKFHLGK